MAAEQTSKQKKRRVVPEPDEEEKHLEALIFGDSSFVSELGKERTGIEPGRTPDEAPDVIAGVDFFIDVRRNDKALAGLSSSAAPTKRVTKTKTKRTVAGLDNADAAAEPDDAEPDIPDARPPAPAAGDDDEEEEEGVRFGGEAAVWEDEDDALIRVNVAAVPRLKKLRHSERETVISGAEYSSRLRQQFQSLQRSTTWADLPPKGLRETDEDGDEEAALFQSSGRMVAARSAALPRGLIDVTRVKDANVTEPCKAVVQSVQFHPSAPLLLTASLDKTLRVFQVDGTKNPKVQSVHIKDMPVHRAAFSADGGQVIATGQRRFYYCWNLTKSSVVRIHGIQGRDEKSLQRFEVSRDGRYIAFGGIDGYIVLVCQRTFRWIANLKMSGTVASLAFSADSSCLYSIGGDGEVYIWDVGTRRCIARHVDDGCVHGTAIDVSPSGNRYATGSTSGVVNVYDSAASVVAATSGKGRAPRPLKALMNLTTAIDTVRFNPTGDMLAIGSRSTKDALRLVHVPSLTTFSNWPTAGSPLHYVSCADFSPNSGYFAVGNDRGRVLLYRLNHYQRA